MAKDARFAHKLADEVHAQAARFLEESDETGETDCKKGCSYCCYQPATVFAFEAIRIAEVLRGSALIEKLKARVSGFAGKSVAANINNKTACPLLVDDKCSIYEYRPLTCRLAHSFSVKKCRLAFEGDRFKVSIPVSVELQTGIGDIIEDLYQRLPAQKLDGKLYELCSAVLAALDDKDAALKWARGDRGVFRGCARDDT